jgi:hypothetical protein
MNRSNGDRQKMLAADIKRQFGVDGTRRFLRSLPMFRLSTDLPDYLQDLLERLDRSSAGAGRQP